MKILPRHVIIELDDGTLFACGHAGSGVCDSCWDKILRNGITSIAPKKKECTKSSDGIHCWHTMPCIQTFIPGGTNQAAIICCWCGETQTIELPTTVSYPVRMEHGEYFKNLVYYEAK